MNVYLGDNQFLGINHASESRAIERSILFQKPKPIIDIIESSYELGYDGFCCTLHEKYLPVFEYMSDKEGLKDFPIIACIPYAHKYAELVTEYGWLGALKELGGKNISNLFLGGIKAFVGKDLSLLARGIIGAELSVLSKLNVKGLYLQNIATDFLLGLGAYDALAEFINQVHSHFGLECGLFTFNPVRVTAFLKEYNLTDKTVICSSINVDGFRMNPSKVEFEKCIFDNKDVSFMGMSIFSSGASSVKDSIEYINNIPLKSVVIGASSKNHLSQNLKSLKQS